MNDTAPPVFDGHNDVLSRLYRAGGAGAAQSFIDGDVGHIDLDKARRGGFGGGFFAVWVASPEDDSAPGGMCGPSYDLPMPEPLSRELALPIVSQQIAILKRLQERGVLRICTRVDAIRDCLDTGLIAAVLHIEGAEAIDRDLHTLDALHAEGLRSLGPVWSRPTIWGDGVPFRFPGPPDIGNGLTPHGINLVKRCNALGIMLDLSHLNEAGFHDVATHSDRPLVATHSNAHALCPHSRNLSDAQLTMIAESDGLVGLNFATAFLREDGQMRPDTSIDSVLRHLDHLLDILGEDGVGFGSDFDGAIVPDGIEDCSGLPVLRRAMRVHGYGDALMRRLCHDNWLRVLGRTWREEDDGAPIELAASGNATTDPVQNAR